MSLCHECINLLNLKINGGHCHCPNPCPCFLEKGDKTLTSNKCSICQKFTCSWCLTYFREEDKDIYKCSECCDKICGSQRPRCGSCGRRAIKCDNDTDYCMGKRVRKWFTQPTEKEIENQVKAVEKDAFSDKLTPGISGPTTEDISITAISKLEEMGWTCFKVKIYKSSSLLIFHHPNEYDNAMEQSLNIVSELEARDSISICKYFIYEKTFDILENFDFIV